MIDHVSIAVRDLAASARFYEAVLATLGYAKLADRPATIGFGKKYPEFWLNERRNMTPVDADSGAHICLRARERGGRAGVSRRGHQGRRHIRRRAGAAFGADRRLLRGVHPRSRRQQDRGRDVHGGEVSAHIRPATSGAMVFSVSAICAAASISIGSTSSIRVGDEIFEQQFRDG